MNLPRLAYIGDVPVEASYHGSALLHRLLRNYPAERLRIVETSMHDSRPDRRLPGVAYAKLDVGARRPLNTRWHPQVSSWYTLRGPARAKGIPAALAGFEPEAILTVAHGYGWLAAGRFCERSRLPLHLVIHDDWPRQPDLVRPVGKWMDSAFGEIYRRCASRLCVSPYMEETYTGRYGVRGSVLLPSRAPDAVTFHAAAPRLTGAGRPLVFGFGGTINIPGYVRALRRLASTLLAIDGRLAIYGPIAADQAASAGLSGPNIELRGLVPAADFIARMRDEVDVLFMPMSFEAADLESMRLSFPSKLADYTAAGLPILAYGPPGSSGVRWARENPGAAEVVETEEAEALESAIHRLASPEHRRALATTALSCGARDFSHSTAQAIFFEHLARRAA